MRYEIKIEYVNGTTSEFETDIHPSLMSPIISLPGIQFLEFPDAGITINFAHVKRMYINEDSRAKK